MGNTGPPCILWVSPEWQVNLGQPCLELGEGSPAMANWLSSRADRHIPPPPEPRTAPEEAHRVPPASPSLESVCPNRWMHHGQSHTYTHPTHTFPLSTHTLGEVRHSVPSFPSPHPLGCRQTHSFPCTSTPFTPSDSTLSFLRVLGTIRVIGRDTEQQDSTHPGVT